MGLLPRHKVFEILAKSDVYVSSSSYEGLPIGVLEAMGCGMPCLVSDIEQHREIKEVIPTLMLCNDNPKNWAEKINIIAHQKPEEINARGISNKEGVIKNFSLENMHNNYTNVYDSK